MLPVDDLYRAHRATIPGYRAATLHPRALDTLTERAWRLALDLRGEGVVPLSWQIEGFPMLERSDPPLPAVVAGFRYDGATCEAYALETLADRSAPVGPALGMWIALRVPMVQADRARAVLAASLGHPRIRARWKPNGAPELFGTSILR